MKTSVVLNSMLIYHFTDPDRGVKIFFGKEGATEKVALILKYGIELPVAHLHLGLKKISCRVCLLWYYILALLTCPSIPGLLNSFDLPSFCLESRKRRALRPEGFAFSGKRKSYWISCLSCPYMIKEILWVKNWNETFLLIHIPMQNFPLGT